MAFRSNTQNHRIKLQNYGRIFKESSWIEGQLLLQTVSDTISSSNNRPVRPIRSNSYRVRK